MGEKDQDGEKSGTGFGFAGDREYARCAAEEEVGEGGDGGSAGEAGVLHSDRLVQRSHGAGWESEKRARSESGLCPSRLPSRGASFLRASRVKKRHRDGGG